MATWGDLLTDYSVATAIGFAANAIAKRIFPGDKIKGDPRWVYYLSLFSQMALFPPLSFLSWREQNYDLGAWFQEPWSKLPSVHYSRLYLAALWGYWAKDMLVLSDPLIVVHHIFCMGSLIVATILRPIGGLGFIVAGTQTLEIGTVCYNWSTLYEKSKAMRAIYWTIISLSNLAASGLAIWFFTFEKMPLYARLWYLATVLGLSVGRQREAILDIFRAKEEWSTEK